MNLIGDSQHEAARLNLMSDVDSGPLKSVFVELERFVEQVRDVDLTKLSAHTVVRQHLLNNARNPGDLCCANAYVAASGGIQGRKSFQQVEHIHDGGERVVDFVG